MDKLDKLLNFFLNKTLGRVIVRAVGSLAIGLASGKMGVKIELTPEQQLELVLGATSGFNALLSWLKPRLPKVTAHIDPITPPVPGAPMKPFDYKP